MRGPELLARVQESVVGLRREAEVLTVALETGCHVVLDGPPGTGKSTLLRAIATASGRDVQFVEGNAELTPARLIGQHDPALVLAGGYRDEAWTDGPLATALRKGGLLYLEELNRIPEETLNVLITAIAEGEIVVPRLGHIGAADGFLLVAAMNPFDAVGTARVSQAIADRMCRIAIGYQDEAHEREIVVREAAVAGFEAAAADGRETVVAGFEAAAADGRETVVAGFEAAAADGRETAVAGFEAAAGDGRETAVGGLEAAAGGREVAIAVTVARATRTHPAVRLGSSVRGAIDMVRLADGLSRLREERPLGRDGLLDAAVASFSGRLRMHEDQDRSAEEVIAELLDRALAAPPPDPEPGRASAPPHRPRAAGVAP